VEEKRLSQNNQGRKLLKDLQFLFEKKIARQMAHANGNISMAVNEEAKVEKLIESMMGTNITGEQLAILTANHRSALQGLFDDVDLDGSKCLDASEVRQLAHWVGKNLDDAALKASMQEMDHDGSGHVEFQEFYGWWTSEKRAQTLGGDGVVASQGQHFDIVPHKQFTSAEADRQLMLSPERNVVTVGASILADSSMRRFAQGAGAEAVPGPTRATKSNLGDDVMRDLSATENEPSLRFASVSEIHRLHTMGTETRQVAARTFEKLQEKEAPRSWTKSAKRTRVVTSFAPGRA
jgi:Ca2+-binding EF-hand superfamily protein